MAQDTDADSAVQDIKRRTGEKYPSEEKIRIVLKGLRGEVSVAELCRKLNGSRATTTSGITNC